jgi:DNA-binding response OmpR family regulator
VRLLIVEDNEKIAEPVRSALAESGFAVDVVGSLRELKAHTKATKYNVIVLDLGLPDGDAIEVLGELGGGGSRAAILVLTARNDVDSRIEGLRRGADDYLGKPFSLEELKARVLALSRRSGPFVDDALAYGNVVLNRSTREVSIDSTLVPLCRAETDLLEQLLLSPATTCTRETLESALFSWDKEFSDNALQLQVHRLRKSLKGAGANICIETLRGIGYRLRGL